jgi:hypothetical protein
MIIALANRSQKMSDAGFFDLNGTILAMADFFMLWFGFKMFAGILAIDTITALRRPTGLEPIPPAAS